jgi:hypothetical protein
MGERENEIFESVLGSLFKQAITSYRTRGARDTTAQTENIRQLRGLCIK